MSLISNVCRGSELTKVSKGINLFVKCFDHFLHFFKDWNKNKHLKSSPTLPLPHRVSLIFLLKQRGWKTRESVSDTEWMRATRSVKRGSASALLCSWGSFRMAGLSPELWCLLASPHRCWAPFGPPHYFPSRRRPKTPRTWGREPWSLRAVPGLQ